MTLCDLIEQCVARGLDWQVSGGIGMNGIPFATALVSKPGEGAAVFGMRTRSGVPVPAAEALKGALADVVGTLEVESHGK